MKSVSLIDRFAGCLLGQAVGDALGAPYEGMTSDLIAQVRGSFRRIVDDPPEVLTYTDDTQMAIGVAETLTACGRIDEDGLIRAFVSNYEPPRGYGEGARRILETVAGGGDWRTLSQTIFPGGSLGNGAAMRAAPVGLFFHHDLDRVWAEARLSALPTHRHPIGIEGAQLVALATALALRDGIFDHEGFYTELLNRVTEDEYRVRLELAATLTSKDALDPLGNAIAAHQSVVTAIACFTVAADSFPEAVWRAISVGGDVDTIAAMAGAMSGARLGIGGVPPRALDRLEDSARGRTYIRQLATALHDASARLC